MRKSFAILMDIVLFDDFLTASDDSSLSTVISIKRYKIGKFHFIDKASYIPLEMICENEVDSCKNDIEKPPPILSVGCIERLRRSESLFHFRINRAPAPGIPRRWYSWCRSTIYEFIRFADNASMVLKGHWQCTQPHDKSAGSPDEIFGIDRQLQVWHTL
jgi:hypothetical protein